MANHAVIAERYALGSVLGRGGMGTVYAAHDLILGREVAVKILDVASAPADALDRFRHEGQFLAGLSHPNVVTIFDFGTDKDTAWLVMELLPGPTLAKLLADQGPLPVGRVITYGLQCIEALSAAHAVGITHRDVKPANLMLGADGHCVLVDLGIARLAGASKSTQLAATGRGLVLGTAAYIAPEIITGGTPGPEADLYALGAVLFSLLTGGPPFVGDTSAAVFGQHVYAAAPRPSGARADTPAALDDLVVGMLAKEPGARPKATAVAATLTTLSTLASLDLVNDLNDLNGLNGTRDVGGPATVPLTCSPSATTMVNAVPAPDSTRVMSTATPAVDTAVRRPARRGLAVLLTLAVAAGVAVAALLTLTSKAPGPTALPPPASSATRPGAQPSPPAASVQAPVSSTQAVTAMRSAITSVAGSGAFEASKAKEAQSWLDDFSSELVKEQPEDLRKKIGEFDQDLTDYRDQQELTTAGYDELTAHLSDLRGTL